MEILIFATQQDAQDALDAFNAIAAGWWAAQGFTVIDDPQSPSGKRVLGKRGGVDDTDGCGTVTWDNVRESPEGTWYWTSPVNDPRFVDWRDYIPVGVTFPADADMPSEWLTSEETV